ncbi:hypothetical protein ACFQ9X_06870 [Catenulispora yoronensis]
MSRPSTRSCERAPVWARTAPATSGGAIANRTPGGNTSVRARKRIGSSEAGGRGPQVVASATRSANEPSQAPTRASTPCQTSGASPSAAFRRVWIRRRRSACGRPKG